MEIFKLLEDLFARNKNYDQICDLFGIPKEERSGSFVGSQIIERIKTYQTAYTIRKSIHERETGAAFHQPGTIELKDPEIPG